MKSKLFYSLLCLSVFFGQAFAQTPQALHKALPVVDSWTISPDIEVFDRDNLYERINGAAPLFLENNFQEMTSLVYTQGDDYITIQAYRHATPEDAFGMYASERSPDMTFYPGIGGEAQGDDYGLFFFAGCIYVKMSSSTEGEAITETFQNIAKGFVDKIEANPSYPAIFNSFPATGLIPHTQSYISLNYIGHEFLKSVYTANYNINDSAFQAFVIDGKTPDGARQILGDYFNFTKQSPDFTEGNILIQDRYNGNIPVVWKGRYITGVFRDNGEDFPETIYDFLSQFK